MLFLASDTELWNKVVFGLEIFVMVVAILMIIIGLLQNKKSQNGLSALNGGNDELFSNSKERGTDKTLSIWMLSVGIILFVLAIVILIISNTVLAA